MNKCIIIIIIILQIQVHMKMKNIIYEILKRKQKFLQGESIFYIFLRVPWGFHGPQTPAREALTKMTFWAALLCQSEGQTGPYTAPLCPVFKSSCESKTQTWIIDGNLLR